MSLVELNDLRTQKATHYRDDVTGQKQAVLSIHDQHYYASGWVKVSESLANSRTAGYAKVADQMRHVIELKDDASRLWLPRRDIGRETVTISPPRPYNGSKFADLSLSSATSKTQALTWSRPLYTVENLVTWRKSKHTIMLLKGAPLRWQWSISLNNLVWDNWKILSGKAIVGWLERPYAFDAKGSPVKLSYTLANGVLDVVVDDTGATYPITIDPTFVDGYGGDATTYVDTELDSASADTNYGSEATIRLQEGLSSTNRRILLKFDHSTLSGATISSATLSLYTGNQLWTENDATVYAHQLLVANDGWTEAGATYNTKDGSAAWAGSAGCGTSGTDYNATADGSYQYTGGNPPALGTEWPISLDTTAFTAMVSANYGYLVKVASASYAAIMGSSDNATTGRRPKLVVEYTAAGPVEVSIAGTLSSSGAIRRQNTRFLIGGLTTSGLAFKRDTRSLVGQLPTAGTLTKQPGKSLAGTLTSGGQLARATQRTLAGGLGLVGQVARSTTRLLDGTLTTAGTLRRQTTRALTGTLAAAGTLGKATIKGLSGLLSLAGALGTATTNRIEIVFAATLNLAGTLGRSSTRSLTGTLNTVGQVFKRQAFGVSGTLTTAGTLGKATSRLLGGILATAGAVESSITQAAGQLFTVTLEATLSTAGAIQRQASRLLGGTLTTAGTLTKQTSRTFAGSLSPAGTLAAVRGLWVVLTGTLTTTGDIQRLNSLQLAGTLSSAGGIRRAISRAINGVLSLAGAIASYLPNAHTKATVTLSDAPAYTVTLSTAAAYTVTLTDQRAYTVTLSEA